MVKDPGKSLARQEEPLGVKFDLPTSPAFSIPEGAGGFENHSGSSARIANT